VQFVAREPITDIDGTYRQWCAERGVTWVLQRPDSYVYGTATSAAGAALLVAGLVERLRMTAEVTSHG
jgi:3-(3-hydroxy-phenyl)propionate hydroxylase